MLKKLAEVFDAQTLEASFSDDQTVLKWHLGQVGPTKFDSFSNWKKFSVYGNELAFWVLLGPSAT